MSPAIVAHLSDIHFGPAALAEVRKCAADALQRLREDCPTAIVLSGDLFDHRLEAHMPAYREAVRWVQQLGDIAPVLVLQGTFSHDVPGMLDVLELVSTKHPIAVASCEGEWILSEYGRRWDSFRARSLDHPYVPEDRLSVYAWPPIQRADFASDADPQASYSAYLQQVHARASRVASAARAKGLPTILTSHGTVQGCVTEHGQVLVTPDHEFGTAELFALGFDAVLLGHIHKHQVWQDGERLIAYAGSLGRICAGDYDPKGWLRWSISPGSSSCELVRTPARDMIDINFDNAPDIEALRAVAAKAEGAIVRIRYSVDQEQAPLVDRAEIARLFAHAEQCKVEGTIRPRLTARSPEIAAARGIDTKLTLWGQQQLLPDERVSVLGDRLSVLLAEPDNDVIVDQILQTIGSERAKKETHEPVTPDPVGV